MGKIILLSENVSNQIAAGEVVERPANVLKELLENSLDAGARNIRINILAAGRKMIEVTDDGSGMDQSDLELSVARYATSKIKDIADLTNLATFGFRGEALAAIALASRLTIISRSADSPQGWQLSVAGGKDKKVIPAGHPVGTTVKVADIFFNTPARKKFLRSDPAELAQIYRVLEEVALANWSVGFILNSNQKNIYNLKARSSFRERANDILAESFGEFVEIPDTVSPLGKIFGLVSRPPTKNISRLVQYLFINHRPVINRRLTYTIGEASRQNIEKDFRPGFIIFLDLKPESVDVNIHPTKREVRLSNEFEIGQWLYQTIKNLFPRSIPTFSGTPVFSEKRSWSAEGQYPVTGKSELPPKVGEKAEIWPGPETRRWQYLGQIFFRYILAADDKNLFFIDQHAAQEILLYEQFLSEWKKGIVSQPLLIPIIKNYPRAISEKIKNNLYCLNELGWQIEEFGPESFRCFAQPQLFPATAAEKILESVLAEIAESEVIIPQADIQPIKEKIARRACHQAIRSRDVLTIPEIQQLLRELENRPDLISCPHGRPVIIVISQIDLDKKFQRT